MRPKLIISVILFSSVFCSSLTNCSEKQKNCPIDRKALVSRHIPILSEVDMLSPFTVGNGEFAFTTDITGLQTFTEYYEKGIPLGTHSQWAWHSTENPNNYSINQTLKYYDTYGRKVPYASDQNSEAGQWLRANPHRLHLGRIAFGILKSDSSYAQLSDIKKIHQLYDIWEGNIKSTFQIEEKEINVETACHPEIDQIAVSVKSVLLQKGRISIKFDFPYGSLSWGKESADWNSPAKHLSQIISQSKRSVIIKRILDNDTYFAAIQWEGTAVFNRTNEHSFSLNIKSKDQFKFICRFSKEEIRDKNPDAEVTINQSKVKWQDFWMSGGAVDLSGSSDPRANELERRIVLSRYLTAIQCSGSMPPQETGLVFNSWHGKSHLEMHWWHAVHFALWGNAGFLEKNLSWYKKIMPDAKQNAKMQGYDGVRWPKMTGLDGQESPSSIGVFLIWQQPHPIYYAELLYRCRKDNATLEKYSDMVYATADFMASYAHWDSINRRYVLGPPLIPAQEIYKPDSTINPAFELSYWLYGLGTAQKWRERQGLAYNDVWDSIINNLSALPKKNRLYQNIETASDTFTDSSDRNDHPALLGAYGMLPNHSIDIETMRLTLKEVLKSWNWQTTWGWDFPLIAMTAARAGEPELAIEALLMDVQKNKFLKNGYNYQDERLPVYLPGNGGLLTAVAMMACGWDGAPAVHAPGFPKNGKWNVKFEGLCPLP